MTKGTLVEKIKKSTNETLPYGHCEQAFDGFCEVARAELANGEEIRMPGLGIFKVKEVKARKGRNPKTGEIIDIPAKRKVVFVPAKALKEAL